MASEKEIEEVRQNVHEPTGDNWDDDTLGALIDEKGVAGASAHVWRKKASAYTELVDVSEAGSSRALGDLQGKALKMAEFFEMEAISITSVETGRVKIHVIDR